MKAIRIFNTFLLGSILALGIVSCNPTNESANRHNIIYAVQNSDTYEGSMSAPTQVSFESDDEWDAQLDDFMDYVQAGNTVTFYNSDISLFNHGRSTVRMKATGPKTSNTIKTTNRNEMKEWCRSMEQQGLTVVMDYDDKTGTWSGYAYTLPPSMARQAKTYLCSFDMGELMLLTVDTLNNRLYTTSSLMIDEYFNLGVVEYNRFNPADSGLDATGNNTWIYMASMLDHIPQNGMHYVVRNNPNFNFGGDSFSLVNLDIPADYYVNRTFQFSTTSDYETWVCEQNGLNIVLHIDRSTIADDSYTFSGYIVIQGFNSMFPILSGQVHIISQGRGSGTDCDENVSVTYSQGDDSECGVELVSDQLVVWHMGDTRWNFVRLM